MWTTKEERREEEYFVADAVVLVYSGYLSITLSQAWHTVFVVIV